MSDQPEPGKVHLNRELIASVMASLEPDQLTAAKAKRHCPRRELTSVEKLLFWALRLYLIFMLGVVLYQIFHPGG